MTGKSHGTSHRQGEKKVTFQDDSQLEYCHNLIAEVHPNPKEDVKYVTSNAMLIARVMDDISSKVTINGALFAQQYILKKGLKVFGQ